VTRRVRFGVSLEREVYEEITRLSRALGVDRSRLVSMAAREFLSARLHFARQHECEGVLVASYPSEKKGEVDEILERSGPLVVGRSHFHSRGGCCVEILYLRGPSDSVWSLQAEISRVCRECSYVPTCA
jgi:CopG family nickel-responsive transcriptional regulator